MSEWSAVQSPMIPYAEQIRWEKITPNQAEALRGGIEGLYFTDTLIAQQYPYSSEVTL